MSSLQTRSPILSVTIYQINYNISSCLFQKETRRLNKELQKRTERLYKLDIPLGLGECIWR